MNRFEYASPDTVDGALALLGESFDHAALIAGGTDLLCLMKDFVVAPRRLVSLAGIPALRAIESGGAGWTIGAMATLDDLLASAPGRTLPALRQAANGVRSPQMRAMGTVGGELLQRPRCWYFRRGLGLLAADGDRSLVADGDNRNHAVFGNAGPAKFVHASSLAPALIALGASAKIQGKRGVRTTTIEELFRAPSSASERESVLGPGDVLVSIDVPSSAPTSATYEVRHRKGMDWPEAAAAVRLDLEGGVVRKAKVVLGHVAPTPWVTAAGDVLVGQKVTVELAEKAARTAIEGATPLSGNAHKVELAKVAVKRAILDAAGRDV